MKRLIKDRAESRAGAGDKHGLLAMDQPFLDDSNDVSTDDAQFPPLAALLVRPRLAFVSAGRRRR
jgi:hypothetical protein